MAVLWAGLRMAANDSWARCGASCAKCAMPATVREAADRTVGPSLDPSTSSPGRRPRCISASTSRSWYTVWTAPPHQLSQNALHDMILLSYRLQLLAFRYCVQVQNWVEAIVVPSHAQVPSQAQLPTTDLNMMLIQCGRWESNASCSRVGDICAHLAEEQQRSKTEQP